MYAECEYVHNVPGSLSTPTLTACDHRPASELHNWRSWLNYHYYNTHSLGPVMS